MGRFLALALVLAASPAFALDPCGPGHMRSEVRGGVLNLHWVGRIERQISTDLSAEFDKHRRSVEAVDLSLTSCGGNSHHMQLAIIVLEGIKATHRLTTLVDRGAVCGSACVPVFLTGKRRVGALSSVWFFHPAHQPKPSGAKGARVLLPEFTEELLRRYFIPAGVSDDWIEYMRRTFRTGDLWQTGRDLWEMKSGILTETLDNVAPREDGPIDLPSPTLACGLVCRG